MKHFLLRHSYLLFFSYLVFTFIVIVFHLISSCNFLFLLSLLLILSISSYDSFLLHFASLAFVFHIFCRLKRTDYQYSFLLLFIHSLTIPFIIFLFSFTMYYFPISDVFFETFVINLSMHFINQFINAFH